MLAGVGTVSFGLGPTQASATITGSTLKAADHVFSLALIDSTTGHPVAVNYGLATTTTADGAGNVQTLSLALSAATVPTLVRVCLLVDAYPVARTSFPTR